MMPPLCLFLCKSCTSLLFSAPISGKGCGLLHRLIPEVCPLPLKRLDYNYISMSKVSLATPSSAKFVFLSTVQWYHPAATHCCSLASLSDNHRDVAALLFDLTNGTSELCCHGISDNIGKNLFQK